jgi:hypothetical protein
LEAYENHTSPHAINQYTPWDQKTTNKVFWRGSGTGDAYTKSKNTKGTWRDSHRPRLALMAQAKEGLGSIWVKRGKEWKLEEWTKKRLNQEYLDIGLTGKPHQVSRVILLLHLMSIVQELMNSVIKKMERVKKWQMRSIS